MEHIDLQPFYRVYREDGSGGASFDPGMMVTLLAYAYLQGMRSSRRIEKKCQEEIVFRVITANQMPDHSTIARFRKKHRKSIQHLFVEVLRLCREAGLGDLRTAAVEATVRCIKLPFRRGKALVRGIGRMTQVMVASAAMINARRIRRFEESRRKELEARRRNEERGEGKRNRKVIG